MPSRQVIDLNVAGVILDARKLVDGAAGDSIRKRNLHIADVPIGPGERKTRWRYGAVPEERTGQRSLTRARHEVERHHDVKEVRCRCVQSGLHIFVRLSCIAAELTFS